MKKDTHASPVGISSFRLFPLSLFLWSALLVVFGQAIGADDVDTSPLGWSEFRGTGSVGISADGRLPSHWSDADYVWRHDLGAWDVGSPVVAGGKVFVLASTPRSQQIIVKAINLESGKQAWSKSYQQAAYRLHKRNTFASGTPAVDASNVFVAWSDPQHTYLKCFDHEGNEVWSRDFGAWQSQHGFGTSPRIFGSMVLLMNSQQADQLRPGQTAGKSRLIAVDRQTGETVWNVDLKTTRSCYGVPAIYKPTDAGPAQVVSANTGNGLFGIHAATGELLWSSRVFRMRCCSTPLVVDDIAIGSSGSGGGGNHLVAVRIPKPGQQAKEVYRIEKNAPYVPTPVVKDGLMFIVSDGGIASCVDAKTGDSKWIKRIGGNFGASPVIVGQKLLLISLDGIATIVSASADFEELGEVDLGGSVGATPAFAGGKLLLRVGDELRCLGSEAI